MLDFLFRNLSSLHKEEVRREKKLRIETRESCLRKTLSADRVLCTSPADGLSFTSTTRRARCTYTSPSRMVAIALKPSYQRPSPRLSRISASGGCLKKKEVQGRTPRTGTVTK